MAFKLKSVKCCGYEICNTKKIGKKHKNEAKADKETAAEEEQEAPAPLVTHVNNIFHSIFRNVEVYINNQQTFNSNGLYAHKSYISNNFLRVLFGYKEVLHCEEHD